MGNTHGYVRPISGRSSTPACLELHATISWTSPNQRSSNIIGFQCFERGLQPLFDSTIYIPKLLSQASNFWIRSNFTHVSSRCSPLQPLPLCSSEIPCRSYSRAALQSAYTAECLNSNGLFLSFAKPTTNSSTTRSLDLYFFFTTVSQWYRTNPSISGASASTASESSALGEQHSDRSSCRICNNSTTATSSNTKDFLADVQQSTGKSSGAPLRWWRFTAREQEKKTQHTLAHIEQYDEDTKLSLMVYHMQELSSVGLTFGELRQDQRFVKLSEEIRRKAKELSPAQLHALCVSLRRLNLKGDHLLWKVVAREIVRHIQSAATISKGITVHQISHAMSCFARQKAEVDRELKAMLSFVLDCSRNLNPRDVICILYTLRSYECHSPTTSGLSEWPILRCLRLCAWVAEQKLREMSARHLAFMVYEFALIGVVPWRVIFQANNIIRQSVDQLLSRELALYVLAISRYKLLDTHLLKRIGKRISDERVFARTPNISASLLLYAYASLDYRDKNLISACCERISRAACTLEDVTVAQLAYSLGRLGVRDLEAWEALAKTAATRICCMSPGETASIVHAVGKVGYYQEDLFEAVTEHIVQRQVLFTPPQILNVLDGLVLAGYFNQELYRVLLENFLRRGAEQDPRGIYQLRRIMFTILLEFPSFLDSASHSVQLLAEQHQQIFLEHVEQPYHKELLACCEKLGLNAKLLVKKGPYKFDARIKLRAKNTSTQCISVAVDFLSDSYHCPVTGNVLGMGRLKTRHANLFGWKYMAMRRNEWLKLKCRNSRAEALQDSLSKFAGVENLQLTKLSDAEKQWKELTISN